jgi:hypothetical protein
MKIETKATREIDSLTYGLTSELDGVKHRLQKIVYFQKQNGAAEKEFFHSLDAQILELRALVNQIESKAFSAEEVSKAFTGGK